MTVTKSRLNEEVPGHQKGFRFKSGSREVSLTKALKYPVYNPVQEKSVLPQSSEALKSGLKMSGSKMSGSKRN